MPNSGTRPIISAICAISYVFSAGSPGPLESITPSCPLPSTAAAGVPWGYTVTAQPSASSSPAMLFLYP